MVCAGTAARARARRRRSSSPRMSARPRSTRSSTPASCSRSRSACKTAPNAVRFAYRSVRGAFGADRAAATEQFAALAAGPGRTTLAVGVEELGAIPPQARPPSLPLPAVGNRTGQSLHGRHRTSSPSASLRACRRRCPTSTRRRAASAPRRCRRSRSARTRDDARTAAVNGTPPPTLTPEVACVTSADGPELFRDSADPRFAVPNSTKRRHAAPVSWSPPQRGGQNGAAAPSRGSSRVQSWSASGHRRRRARSRPAPRWG